MLPMSSNHPNHLIWLNYTIMVVLNHYLFIFIYLIFFAHLLVMATCDGLGIRMVMTGVRSFNQST